MDGGAFIYYYLEKTRFSPTLKVFGYALSSSDNPDESKWVFVSRTWMIKSMYISFWCSKWNTVNGIYNEEPHGIAGRLPAFDGLMVKVRRRGNAPLTYPVAPRGKTERLRVNRRIPTLPPPDLNIQLGHTLLAGFTAAGISDTP